LDKPYIAVAVSCLLLTVPCRFATPLQEVHPGWDLMTIRPTDFMMEQNGRNYDEFTYGISAMDWLSDGRLVVATYFCPHYAEGNDIGYHADPLSIWALAGVQGDDRDAITVEEIAREFRDAHGLKVLNDTLYILSKQKITRCVQPAVPGDLWDCVKIFDIPDYKTIYENHGSWAALPLIEGMGQFHQFNFGLPYRDGWFYVGLANEWPPETGGQGEDRGNIIRVRKDGGAWERYSGGHRTPGGIAFGPEGRLFVTENQGHWMPANKLIQAQEGRFYGFRFNSNNFFYKQGLDESPPAVWVGQGTMGNSPTFPCFITEGIYKGQMFIGDNFYGGIQRYFLERVDGEYQGCIFRHSGGFEAAVQVIIRGPGDDSAYYLGQLGGPGSNWKWQNKLWGMQRVRPNGTVIFEMLAVRSMADGFEIEFTKPVDRAAGGLTSTYGVQKWTHNPVQDYGGGANQQGGSLSVTSAQVSGDGRRVLLVLNDIPQYALGTVFQINVNGLQSESGEALYQNETHYTMLNKGPADDLGCTDADYLEYDDQAAYDDGLQCRTLDADRRSRLHSGEAAGFSIQTSGDGSVSIHIPFTRPYRLSFTDVNGRVLASFSGRVPERFSVPGTGLPRGIYLATVTSDGHSYSRSVVVY
jgi:hypothetical protein